MSAAAQTGVIYAIRDNFEALTQTERRLANTMMDHYPVSCLGTLTTIAEAGAVSTPTVLRMVKKIGYSGFPDFQAAVRSELEQKISNPIEKYNKWSKTASDGHILNKFADAVLENLTHSLTGIDPYMFDEVVEIFADERKNLNIVGGRVSRSLADYLFTHMQVARENVTCFASNANIWHHYLLNMKSDDVLVVFDIRRYEHSLINLSKLAKERGAKIVLFTDQWSSPAAKSADYVFNLRTEVPSPWDSSVVILFVLETLIAAVQAKTWKKTRHRMAELETLFDEARLFKKFNY